MKILMIWILVVSIFWGLMELNCWYLERERRLIMSGKKLPWGHRKKGVK
jgi:hypothetical protein